MSGSSASQDWRVNPLVELHWHMWVDEAVAFDAVSGQILACDALEAALLACLESGIHRLDVLHRQLAADLGVPESDDLAQRLREIIADFVLRGWVEPLS
jgi:hypothetical protein